LFRFDGGTLVADLEAALGEDFHASDATDGISKPVSSPTKEAQRPRRAARCRRSCGGACRRSGRQPQRHHDLFSQERLAQDESSNRSSDRSASPLGRTWPTGRCWPHSGVTMLNGWWHCPDRHVAPSPPWLASFGQILRPGRTRTISRTSAVGAKNRAGGLIEAGRWLTAARRLLAERLTPFVQGARGGSTTSRSTENRQGDGITPCT
jgi:hypothetical protein